jgi:hypothetical protein
MPSHRNPAQLAKFIVDMATGEVEDREPTVLEKGKNPAAAEFGRTGGKLRTEKLSAARRKEIALKAASARWRKRD